MKLLKLSLVGLCLGSTPALAQSVDGTLMVLSAMMNDGTEKKIYQLHTDTDVIELTGEVTHKLPAMSEIPITAEITQGTTDTATLDSFKLHSDLAAEKFERGAISPERHMVMYVIDGETKKASTVSTVELLTRTWGEVDSFYKTVSLGLISFPNDANKDGKPDIFGPFVVTGTKEVCKSFQAMSNKAQAQARQLPGFDENLFTNKINVLPDNLGCDWSGLGYVGCKDKCELWVSYKPQSPSVVYNHELGHNFGLDHASTDTNDDGRKEIEYGDWSDVMGNRFDGIETFNAAHHEQLGWYSLKAEGWITQHKAKTTETYQLRGLAAFDGSLQAVKIRRPKGGSYYVSYRAAVGLDAGIDSRYKDMVLVHSWDGRTQSAFIVSVKLGYQVTLGGSVTIKFNAASSGVATVEVISI